VAKKGFLSSFFGKSDVTEAGNPKVVRRLSQELLQKLMKGNAEGAARLLEDTNLDDETRAALIAYCETLVDVGLKPARKALTIALQRSPLYQEKEQAALPYIKMTAVQEEDTAAQICERVRDAMPSQVFVTGGGIFNEVVSSIEEIRAAVGADYNVRLLNTTSRALIRHGLIALKREIRADPGKRNLVIGIYPSVGWSYFLPFPPSTYDLFSPWPWPEHDAAVFLIGALSYAYVVEVASLLNGDIRASGSFENLVCIENPRLTNRIYDQLRASANPEEQSALLLQFSKAILKSYEEINTTNMVLTGSTDALESVRHLGLADMFISRGMYERAIPKLEKMISLERDRRTLADGKVDLALCYAQLGRFDKADQVLQKASESSPSWVSEARQIIEVLRGVVDRT
jgi:tetratricopeptide (TPR) repeat protein